MDRPDARALLANGVEQLVENAVELDGGACGSVRQRSAAACGSVRRSAMRCGTVRRGVLCVARGVLRDARYMLLGYRATGDPAMLRYCELDTLAMVMIMQEWVSDH